MSTREVQKSLSRSNNQKTKLTCRSLIQMTTKNDFQAKIQSGNTTCWLLYRWNSQKRLFQLHAFTLCTSNHAPPTQMIRMYFVHSGHQVCTGTPHLPQPRPTFTGKIPKNDRFRSIPPPPTLTIMLHQYEWQEGTSSFLILKYAWPRPTCPSA